MTSKPKPHKKATFNQSVQAVKKAVVVADPDAFLQQCPTWRFGLLEMAPPYGCDELSLEDATEIRQRLAAFESMMWQEILFSPNVGKQPNHHMPVADITCEKAIMRLQEIAPDVDTLMSLRVNKTARIWGIMSGSVCQLVFWDPEHTIYKMNLTDN